MTDPCDNLSDELVEVLLFDVRYARLSPRERQHICVNAQYGKMVHLWKGHTEYGRLIAASLRGFFTNYKLTVKSKAEAHQMFEVEYPAINKGAEAVLPHNHPLVRILGRR